MKKVIKFPARFVRETFPSEGQQCGLCGKSENLVKTSCCDNWVCNDTHKTKRKSCYRGHESFTVCANHHMNQHSGKWQDCEECKSAWEVHDFVWYATNEFNFEKLVNPPEVPVINCIDCNEVINIPYEDYVSSKEGKQCLDCALKLP